MKSAHSLYIPSMHRIHDFFEVARSNNHSKPAFHFISVKNKTPLKIAWNDHRMAWFNEVKPWQGLGWLDWQNNKWMINTSWQKYRATDELIDEYHNTLCYLALDPFKFATAFVAKTTNHCMFCGIQLTHPNSVAAGYGPICAAKYGLPWEGQAEKEKEAQREMEAKLFVDSLMTEYEEQEQTSSPKPATPPTFSFKPSTKKKTLPEALQSLLKNARKG